MSKKKFKTILCGCITTLCLLLTSCGPLQISQGSGNQDSGHRNQTTAETTFASTGQIESVDTLEEVPEYTGQPYVEINDNEPSFTKEELTTDSYEEYSPLDELGRCQTAEACVGEDLMPTQKRESISSVKPTGWVNKEYDGIDGGYLYNRCHLIGFQLTGENANERNLITGTRYMNVEGMLPFEDEVAAYIKETDNHVMYRVTPVFEGDDLVASGVQMQAESVEDDGVGISFNVYVYNVQPYVVIDYKTGNTSFDLVYLYHGLQLQLMIYLDGALRVEQKKYPDKEIIPAGVFYYNIKDPMIQEKIDADVEAVSAGLMKELKMNGLVQADPELVYRMDSSLGSIPVAFNKDGSFRKNSSVADRTQFAVLGRYVRTKIEKIRSSILEGDAEVSPYELGKKNACTYCPYMTVCGFDRKLSGYEFHRLKNFSDEELWKVFDREAE